MLIEAVVADANVLLSSVIGKAAIRVFVDHRITVHVTRFNADEVEEYLPHFAKYNIPLEILQLQWKLLPIAVHAQLEYEEEMLSALTDHAEDAHALALARKLKIPIWSNDRDLQNCGVQCLTTAQFLKLLDSKSAFHTDNPLK